tara:strand:+ start:537 stop:773 length:237 start_codon:yes stop_codon:yes gene_type:complete
MIHHPPHQDRLPTIFVDKIKYDRWVTNINKSNGGYSYIYHIGRDSVKKRRIQFHTNGRTLWCLGVGGAGWHVVAQSGD